ncbi:MAG: formylglycine-generating enzyme family protein [Gemmataceae bacterium]|nr:formylglycine-generating enzyme family protein [Gemmataceae bacterium]
MVPKGLRSFDAEDADFFLHLLPGPRDRHGLPDSIRFWKTRLEETDADKTFSVGLIYGPSGCGKSSLVKAGLLPRLARCVVPIYLEATPEDTEVRLLGALRKRCPDLPADLPLPEALALLRRGRGLAAGNKILLLLDQFEQCLHAGGEQPNSPLVQALRQCDGQRVQAVILVRDDFWMAATRFMREVEVRLLENHNSVAVDLFDLRHARKVLAEFGRAFGALPNELSQRTREQERFLDQAVAGLAREGKVISVRLALFAEMVKTKPWTPATLKQVGGMEGIGVTFLEETFSAATASPAHRLHQKAARSVLQALLPQPGTDLKGHRRGRQELLEASGYARRPRDFNDLMYILDTELRLVTPTDPESVEDRGSRIEDRRSEMKPGVPRASILDPRSSGYYQLTHDYLVPALRQWLTRKQRETHRGRTELRLAERVALWSARPETRHLPGWWEWLNFLLFTRQKDRTTTQREMMLVAASRLHLLQAGVGVILLTLAGWGIYERMNYLEAVSRVQALQSAKIDTVHRIISELSPYRRWADPLLRNMARGFWQGSNERLYANLALLPVEPDRLDYLYKRIPEAGLDELRVLCDTLKPHQEALGPRLWAYLETETDPDRRFRVACVLSEYEDHDPRWNALSAEVTNKLIREALENPLVFDKWRSFAFRSMRFQIRPHLEAIILDPHRPEAERSMARQLFLQVAGAEVTPKELLDLVLATEDRTYELIRRLYLAADPRESAELLHQELAKALPANAPDEARDVLAKRQAHAAVVLLQHDQPEEIWPLPHADRIWPRLRHSPDCRLRTYLIHRFAAGGAEQASLTQQSLLRQYEAEQDVSARRALLLSLGEFKEDRLPAEKRQPLVATLLQTYRDDPDPGIHAAVDWLLRQCWEQGAELHQIDRELSGKPADSRQWYVNGQGQTLAILRDPVEFLMGSPTHERDRQADESPHCKRIPRSFALATKEVTVQQFQEFLQANPGIRHDWEATQKYSQEPDAPVISVTWFEAARYCRWLSEREGIPEDEMCYPRIDAIKEGMQLPADYLARTGYRLPTEAEWEYACRAGAVTSRHYGVTEDLLPKYACYAGNARGRTQPVGRGKPNDSGLFDMYGNAWEWCQDALLPYPSSSREQVLEDREDPNAITGSVNRVLRGGSFASPAAEVRSACRFELPPTIPRNLAGLRVARTHR